MEKLETVVNNENSVEKITVLWKHLRESGHTLNWEVVEILSEENSIVE